MGFSKAKPQQAFLKVGLYGPPGSGKTFTALLMAEGLAAGMGKRVAVVDTERGTDFYAMAVDDRQIHPQPFDFDALYTRSLSEVLESVRAIDTEKYGVVILDSISHLWDAAIEAYNGRKTKADTIPMSAWGKIKRPYKDLVRYMLDCPMHIFILGRQKNIFEDDGEKLKKVGVGMRAEGETEYEPHICIRMETNKNDPGGTVFANVEKDRTGILAGRVIPNPSFQTVHSIVPLLGGSQAKSEDPDDVAARDAELLDEEAKAAKKEEKSQGAWVILNDKLVKAQTLEDLNAAAGEIKKAKRGLVEEHIGSLQMLYTERRKAITAAATPQEV